MIVLVLGADGMLGRTLLRSLQSNFDVHGSIRGETMHAASDPATIHAGINVLDDDAMQRLVDKVRPQIVINAVGIVKQRSETVETFISVNALFPHRLANMLRERESRLIHVSTDCVFSGRKGGYREEDAPDPQDVYGMTKFLGEPSGDGTTVIRCSMIGVEEGRSERPRYGLISWFLEKSRTIDGFARSIFSGLTVAELGRVIQGICLERGPEGLWHIAAAPITKFDLLERLSARLPERGLEIRRVNGPVIDRSLDAGAFTARTGYVAPGWDVMLDELAHEIRSTGPFT